MVDPADHGLPGRARSRAIHPLLAVVLVPLIAVSTAAAAWLPSPADPIARPTHWQPAAADTTELVVLVHGLGRTPLSMLPLRRALEDEGYRVLNWGYSSTCCSIAELGRQLRQDLRALPGPEPRRIHFVGHSLGAVIIRWVLVHGELGRTGRVVMLAPPNRGSHTADRWAPWLSWLLKPLPELRTEPRSTARSLGMPPGVPVAVIAAKSDGKVSLAETHLEGETVHHTVPGAHSFLMFKPIVQRLTIDFLRGRS